MSQDFGVNQGLVEEQFLKWAANPGAVDPAWRRYFDALPESDWPRLTSAGTVAAVAPSGDGDGNGHGTASPTGSNAE